MKKILYDGNEIHNFIFSSGSGTVIYYGSSSDFLTSYGSGSISQKVTVPTVPVPVPQHSMILICLMTRTVDQNKDPDPEKKKFELYLDFLQDYGSEQGPGP